MWPLVGRDRELGSVDELLSQGSVRGVVLAGAAGVGKTRLATEMSRAASSRGCAVEWVRATGSGASISLGAFAALLPAAGTGSADRADLLARARLALMERAGGRRLVLCIDDGQVLDDASAALVHQLVGSGDVFAIVTLRLGEPVPDALRSLWKDELCVFWQLADLSRDEVERLLALVLGGPVDGRSADTLWKLTHGNPLFLRELVREGLERAFLTDEGGIWRWRGGVTVGVRLAELIGARLDALGADALGVLEVVAVGAPLEVGFLDQAELALLEALELREAVARRVEGRRRFVDVAHPLHGEVVRARLSHTRLEAIQRRLAHALESGGARRTLDAARLAWWRLESGGPGDAELFARAADQALAVLDFALAERFARAAVQAGGGFGPRLVLGRAVAGAGRAEEARVLFGELDAQAGDDAQRAALAIATARNLFFALDGAEDADATLRRAEQMVADDALRHELIALRVRLASAQSRPLDTLAAARPLLDDVRVPERARLYAAVAVAEALLFRGRLDEAGAIIERWLQVARRHRDELPSVELQLLGERALALRLAGRLVEATDTAQRMYELALVRRSAQNTAPAASVLGMVWLARGRVRTALRLFSEGAALLRDADSVGLLPWMLAGVAQGSAQAGDAGTARAAIDQMQLTSPTANRAIEPELHLARAWCAAAEGEVSRACRLAADGAAVAQSRGQDAFALRAWHELCRLGDPASAAERLASLAGRVDGDFAATAARHAAALVASDGGALLDVAERFADQDALLLSAEAADAAAAAYRDAGRHASARAAAARSAVHLNDCEGARPPTLHGAPVAAQLTPREREIALLAASGLSSRDIAERLVVSLRTVDNTLLRAYRKLGISRRADLAALVTVPRE
jgi:DNA-binding CsgD family transcriptional regulator